MNEFNKAFYNILVFFLVFACRCKRWVINIRRADLDNKSAEDLHKNYFLCAYHFEDSQFLNGFRNRLKWNAVPTLFNVCMIFCLY
jgi:hypothetical protein